MSNVLNFFRAFDCLGPEIKLTHMGAQRYKTILGALFSALPLILAIFSVYNTIEDVFKRQNPNESISKKLSFQATEFNAQEFLFMIKLYKVNESNNNALEELELMKGY